MSTPIQKFETDLAQTYEWLREEFTTIRTGRASSTLLDSVRVAAYGSKMPLAQVATIGTEDPRTLRIAPWDASLGNAIESAIRDADLGVSLAADSKGIRVIFPELTKETREKLLKVAKDKHEEARITLRKHREEIMKAIDQDEESGAISQDEKFRKRDEVQKLIDDMNKKLDELLERKKAELVE